MSENRLMSENIFYNTPWIYEIIFIPLFRFFLLRDKKIRLIKILHTNKDTHIIKRKKNKQTN